jgi:hypothetical protein
VKFKVESVNIAAAKGVQKHEVPEIVLKENFGIVGDTITIGEVELEITQIGKECHSRCAIYYAAGDCIMPKQGIFARVLKGGSIHAQSSGDHRIG